MRWPTDNLVGLLKDLRLCSKTELQACEPIVRRLCHDLPAFDSAWVDALVQLRILTPWQATRLQSKSPETLRINDLLVQDELGKRTWLAEDNDGVVAVRALADRTPQDSATGESVETLDRESQGLEAVIGRLEGDATDHPAAAAIALPDRIETLAGGQRYLVSEYVAGWNAEELLIRGGRLPWQSVVEIAGQLIAGLAWLESQGLFHGEIVLRNLVVEESGRATLVAPFVERLRNPVVSIAGTKSLRDVETTAPELTGSGRTTTSQSDLYSLGCVLWQLLAGRPPFLSADPITRLQQAQSRDLPPLRELVPDCPEKLATVIHGLARRSPELRPPSFEHVSAEWPVRRFSSKSDTRRMMKTLPDRSRSTVAVRSKSSPKSRSPWARLAAVAVMLPLFAGYAWYRGLLPQTLLLSSGRSPNELVAEFEQDDPDARVLPATQVSMDEPAIRDMPAPDLAGVVLLRSGRVYRARDLEFTGVMHIETDGRELATVLVQPDGWSLKATHVSISRAAIEFESVESSEAKACLQIRSSVLSMSSVILNSHSANTATSGVLWTPLAGDTQILRVTNAVISGNGYGLWLRDAPGRLELDNVLFKQEAGAVRCDSTRQKVRLDVSRTTQIGGHAFLDVVPSDSLTSGLHVELKSGESVLAPSTALVRAALNQNLTAGSVRVEFILPERGNPTIVPPDIDPVVYFERSLNQFVGLRDSQILSESLLLAKPLFRGTAQGMAETIDAYELLDYEGPKLNPRLPGISVHELPRISESTRL